jgi:hypothetical protein
MTQWIPLNRQRHQQQRWRARQDFRHSSGQSLVPILLGELGQLMGDYALAFTDQDGGYAAVAVLGLGQAEHFFLGPNGQWLADYVPARLRTYPFQLLAAGEGKHVLCIHEAHFSDDPADDVLFDDDGMSASVQEQLSFLQHVEQQNQVTQRASDQLAKRELIEPWPLTLSGEQKQTGDQSHNDEAATHDGPNGHTRKQTIQGLFRINEAALNALSGDALAELRASGALALAYSQLLSTPRMQQLAKRAQWQARLASHVAQSTALASQPQSKETVSELFSESSGGSLNFDDL